MMRFSVLAMGGCNSPGFVATTRSLGRLRYPLAGQLAPCGVSSASATTVLQISVSGPRLYSHDHQKYRLAHRHSKKRNPKGMPEDGHQHREEAADTIVEFQCIPMGTSSESSSYVATSAHVVAASGLKHEVHPMGVVVEGNLDECFDTIKDAVRKNMRHTPRMIVAVRADVCPGKTHRMSRKHAKIQEIMAKVGPVEQ